ncbi:MAG: hypothetical protein MUF14_07350 [Hyphomonadaceae bacterium]|nr:hypothetical protein [Hyphomonadaceae bacterium]
MPSDPIDDLLKRLASTTRTAPDFERRFWTRLANGKHAATSRVAGVLPVLVGGQVSVTLPGWNALLALAALGVVVAALAGYGTTAISMAAPAASGFEPWLVPVAVSSPSTVLGG